MWVKELSLQNFRNFDVLQVKLENRINIVFGNNANGKTNFIEAIYFCAVGRSKRAGHDKELIQFGQNEAHLQAIIETRESRESKETTETTETIESIESRKPKEPEEIRKIDVHLFRDGKRKGIAIDHIPIKKLSQLFGLLLVVIFTPEDLQMIKSGPAERRAFMDVELCQLSSIYYHALRRYHKALKQRNTLLKTIPKDRGLIDTLEIWDEPLCEYGKQIMTHRSAFIEEVAHIAKDIHNDITGGKENLTLEYRPQVADNYKDRLKRSIERDIATGNTSVGVHKDDIICWVNGNDVRTYGSQGQQRTAALSIKLAEIDLIKKRTGRTPILLLDDVLSELDESRQTYLFNHIKEIQTILTCTGVEDVLKKTTGNIMEMKKGEIHGVHRR